MDRNDTVQGADWRATGRAWDVEGSRARLGDLDALVRRIDALMDGYDEHPAEAHLTFDELGARPSNGAISAHLALCRFCARMRNLLQTDEAP